MNKEVAIPHKHQTLISVWAADPTTKFEYRVDGEDWNDCGDQPMWREYHQYRVKPKPQVAKYRVAYCDLNGDLEFSNSFYRDKDAFRRGNPYQNVKWVQILNDTKEFFDDV